MATKRRKKATAKSAKSTASARTRTKRGGRKTDKRWHTNFINALKDDPNVLGACDVAGINRQTAYNHRRRFSAFRARWDAALEEGREVAQTVVRDTLLACAEKAATDPRYQRSLVFAARKFGVLDPPPPEDPDSLESLGEALAAESVDDLDPRTAEQAYRDALRAVDGPTVH